MENSFSKAFKSLQSPLSFLSARRTFARKRWKRTACINRKCQHDFDNIRRDWFQTGENGTPTPPRNLYQRVSGIPYRWKLQRISHTPIFFLFSSAQILQPTTLTIIFLSKKRAPKSTRFNPDTVIAMSRDYQNESVRSICLHQVISTTCIYIKKMKLLAAVLNAFSSHWWLTQNAHTYSL